MNTHVSAYLSHLALSEQSNKFRANAFRKAAAVVAAKSFADDEAEAALRGVLSDKMMEHAMAAIAAYGDGDGERTGDAVSELMKVTCIGEAAARRLRDRGVLGVADLQERVRLKEDLGLTRAQLVCIEHHDAIQQRIPRAELDRHAALVAAQAHAAGQRATVVGSYRRKAESSGDIDVLLVGDMKTFVDKLKSTGYIVDAIAEGDHKFMGLARLPGGVCRRIDVLCTPEAVYPFAMLHFTGPMEFNVSLRKRAIKMNIKLSERGWSATEGVALPAAASEGDILARLGVRWTEPEDRSGELVASVVTSTEA